MSFYTLKLNFLFILIVLALFNAFIAYAPVKTDRNRFADDRPVHVINKQGLNIGNEAITKNIRNYQVVINWWPFHSMNLSSSSGYVYQRPAPLNQKALPYNIMVGRNIKLPNPESQDPVKDKKQHNTREKYARTRPKKTIKSVLDKTGHEDKKQQSQLDAAKNSKRKHKSTVSINNSKHLELSFGWPMRGRVLKSFSPSHNKGIDIAGKNGQPVKATEAGKVVYGGQGLIGFGKLLIISHNDVYLSAYANNSRLLVNEGQHVQKGQIIAEVGDVGIKRTSLHFEIRKNGTPVNPLKLLPKK